MGGLSPEVERAKDRHEFYQQLHSGEDDTSLEASEESPEPAEPAPSEPALSEPVDHVVQVGGVKALLRDSFHVGEVTGERG